MLSPTAPASLFLRLAAALLLPLNLLAFAAPAAERTGAAQTALTAPPITFSAHPSDSELGRCALFPEPLTPIGSATSAAENRALADALLDFATEPTCDRVEVLNRFLDAFPNSAWRVSLLTNIGLLERLGCYWTRALTHWQQAWAAGKAEADPQRSLIADRAVGQLAELTARIGRVDELRALLLEIAQRPVRGPAAEKIAQARQSLALMQEHPEKSFLCGPYAVGHIWALGHPKSAAPEALLQATCSPQGTTLVQAGEFAAGLGLPCQAAFRTPGAAVLYPAVVHWNVGHFAALTRKYETGMFGVEDPTFTEHFSISAAGLDAEASGYFLVPAGPLPEGWRAVPSEEAAQVWGRGAASPTTPPGPPCTGVTVGCAGCGAGGTGNRNMPGYSVDPSRVNLFISDSPVYYTPPHGPGVEFAVTYSQRDVGPSGTPNFPNLGRQWNCNWVAYILDDPNNAAASSYGPGGGTLNFTGYDSATASYQSQTWTQGVLKRTSATSYVQTFPDGSRQVFSLADNSAARKRVYLTEYDDAVGNKMTYQYDPATFRLVSVKDNLGRATTIAYSSEDPAETTGAFYRIASVTDFFGHTATFAYQNGRLAGITDLGGLTTAFGYAPSTDTVTSMTTPYGVTQFETKLIGTTTDRDLLITDPLGEAEYFRFVSDSITAPDAGAPYPTVAATATEPAILPTRDSYNRYRTTYHWDKKAYHDAPGDYAKAHLYHFTHANPVSSGVMGDTLESEKKAFESRIYYNYPGQTDGFTECGRTQPSLVARVLDDGNTQFYRYQYNALGRPTSISTPGKDAAAARRVTTFAYYPNNIDVQYIYQQNPAGVSMDGFGKPADLLASFTYEGSTHLVKTVADASAQATSFTRNAFGQVLTMQNAKLETTTYVYDRDQDNDGKTDGYLLSITGPVAGAQQVFTYDAFERPHTVKNSDNDILTIDYEQIDGVAARSFDRPSKVTYPDNTFVQYSYNRLDTEWMQDRSGRWTHVFHDARQRVAAVEDPLGRLTQYVWCGCGGLEAIIDPAGNQTTWFHDEQGRITQKIYADNSLVQYDYEPRSGRMHSVTDAKRQVTSFTYNLDNTRASISYSGGGISTPTTSFGYDAVYVRMNQMTDGTGTTTYGYAPIPNSHDPTGLGAGLLESISGPLANSTITYQYDELGRGTSRSIGGGTVAETVLYDSLGRVQQLANGLGSFGFFYVGQTGRFDHVSYPNGQSVHFDYWNATAGAWPIAAGDAARRLKQIRNDGVTAGATTPVLSQFDYDYQLCGEIDRWTQSNMPVNGTQLATQQFRFGYDAVDQLTSASLLPGGSTTPQHTYTYGFDPAGNRQHEQKDGAPGSGSFNELNQQLTAGGTEQYLVRGSTDKPSSITVAHVDSISGQPSRAVSARIDPTTRTFEAAIDVKPNAQNTLRITATDLDGHVTTKNPSFPVAAGGIERAFQYDGNGNRVAELEGGAILRTYEWDGSDRLVAINYLDDAHYGARTEFVYDGMSHRTSIVERNSAGSILADRRFLWESQSLVEERTPTGAVVKRFFPQGEERPGAGPGGGTLKLYYTRDHLGSVREVTDATGAIRARYAYDLWGTRTQMTGDLTCDFGFAGQYHHASSGLNLAPYRAYDPTTGRWLNRDPIQEAGGLNLYRYVENRPASKIDPTGLITEPEAIKQLFEASKELDSAEADLYIKNAEYFLAPAAAKGIAAAGQNFALQRWAEVQDAFRLAQSQYYAAAGATAAASSSVVSFLLADWEIAVSVSATGTGAALTGAAAIGAVAGRLFMTQVSVGDKSLDEAWTDIWQEYFWNRWYGCGNGSTPAPRRKR